MPHPHDTLKHLAAARRRRLSANGRPAFDLTPQEIEQSTRTAMRLANATTPQPGDTRATAIRDLLENASPHGGATADQVKASRPVTNIHVMT